MHENSEKRKPPEAFGRILFIELRRVEKRRLFVKRDGPFERVNLLGPDPNAVLNSREETLR